jgi:hypothetical protein
MLVYKSCREVLLLYKKQSTCFAIVILTTDVEDEI